jgi:hypothetical protein
VGEPAPARGGAIVGGKGCLIFLYSDNSDALTTREVGRAEAFDEQQVVLATHEGRVFLRIIVGTFADCIVSGLKKAAGIAISSFHPTFFLTNWDGDSFVFLLHIRG